MATICKINLSHLPPEQRELMQKAIRKHYGYKTRPKNEKYNKAPFLFLYRDGMTRSVNPVTFIQHINPEKNLSDLGFAEPVIPTNTEQVLSNKPQTEVNAPMLQRDIVEIELDETLRAERKQDKEREREEAEATREPAFHWSNWEHDFEPRATCRNGMDKL